MPSYSPEQMDLIHSIFHTFRDRIDKMQRDARHKTNDCCDYNILLQTYVHINNIIPNPLDTTYEYIRTIMMEEVK